MPVCNIPCIFNKLVDAFPFLDRNGGANAISVYFGIISYFYRKYLICCSYNARLLCNLKTVQFNPFFFFLNKHSVNLLKVSSR